MTLWTRKEACLKALGTGLTLDPARFEVGLAPEPTGAHGALALEVHVPLADGRIACVHCIDVGLGIEPDAGAPRPLVAAAAWTTSTAPNAASAGIGC
jgi:4'-phosphopantetheinyl transferase